jgi:hypothetical protein
MVLLRRQRGIAMRLAPTVVFVVLAGFAGAADVPISAERLRLAIDARTEGLKVRFVSRDPAITKGAAGDPSKLAGTFTIVHADDVTIQTGFTTEPAYWKKNTATGAAYAFTATEVAPPMAHRVRKILLREGRVLKVATRDLVPGFLVDGNPPPGPAGVVVVLELTNGNDGSTRRFCTRFSAGDGSIIALEPDDPPAYRAAHGVPVPCPSLAYCGNGTVDQPGEQCDGPDSVACSGLCQADCTCPPPVCGNGVLEGDEQCDGGAFGFGVCEPGNPQCFPAGDPLECQCCTTSACIILGGAVFIPCCPGFSCVSVLSPNVQGLCFLECSTPADCPGGTACLLGVCVDAPACNDTPDCVPPAICAFGACCVPPGEACDGTPCCSSLQEGFPSCPGTCS